MDANSTRKPLHPLRLRRLERDMRIAELARAVGVSPATIANIERYRFSGSVRTRAKLARFLGCSIDDLIASGEAE